MLFFIAASNYRTTSRQQVKVGDSLGITAKALYNRDYKNE